MINKDQIYINKRWFVENLNGALSSAGEPLIEYWHIRDKYSEYLSVKHGGTYRYINVTGNSLHAIAQEISRIILNLDTDAEITDQQHKNVIEGWIEAERAK